MASLSDIIRKQRSEGSSRTGALFSSVGMKVLESIDPRRMLNQTGLLTALFPSLKAFKASGSRPDSRVAKASSDFAALSTPILQEMVTKLDTISSISKITAKNTQALPGMARDMNVMRQNVIKLVKLQGGKASTRADAFFTRAFERERATEAELMAAKDQQRTGATKVEDKGKSGGGGMFGGLLGLLAAGGLMTTLTKIPDLIMSGLAKIPSLILEGLIKIPSLILQGLGGLTSLLSKGINITFGALSGLANTAANAAGSIFNIIKAAAGILLSGPGLAVLGVGGIAALLAYLLTNDKNQTNVQVDGDTPEDTSYTPISENAKGLAGIKEEQAKQEKGLSDKEKAELQRKRNIAAFGAKDTPSTSPTPTTTTAGQSTSPKVVPTISANELGGLDYNSYARTIGQRESGGNYKAVNTLGYLGKYQFGAMALEDMGLVKKGVGAKGQKALDDPSNWTISGGKEAFLNDATLQENVMARYTKENFNRLQKLGVINTETTAEKIGGYLASAHLVGPGGAAALFRGEDKKDAYGTSAGSYFMLGAASQGNLQVASKTTGEQLSQASADSRMAASAAGQAPSNVVIDNKTINGGGNNQPVAILDKAAPYHSEFYRNILGTVAA